VLLVADVGELRLRGRLGDEVIDQGIRDVRRAGGIAVANRHVKDGGIGLWRNGDLLSKAGRIGPKIQVRDDFLQNRRLGHPARVGPQDLVGRQRRNGRIAGEWLGRTHEQSHFRLVRLWKRETENARDQRRGKEPVRVRFTFLELTGGLKEGFLRALDWEELEPHVEAAAAEGGSPSGRNSAGHSK